MSDPELVTDVEPPSRGSSARVLALVLGLTLLLWAMAELGLALSGLPLASPVTGSDVVTPPQVGAGFLAVRCLAVALSGALLAGWPGMPAVARWGGRYVAAAAAMLLGWGLGCLFTISPYTARAGCGDGSCLEVPVLGIVAVLGAPVVVTAVVLLGVARAGSGFRWWRVLVPGVPFAVLLVVQHLLWRPDAWEMFHR